MIKYYLYISAVVFFDVLAIIAGKFWYLTGKPLYMIGCMTGFAIAGFFFAMSLKWEGAAITNVLWTAGSIVVVTLIGYFFFKEHITLPQLIGIFVVIAGIVLLNIRY